MQRFQGGASDEFEGAVALPLTRVPYGKMHLPRQRPRFIFSPHFLLAKFSLLFFIKTAVGQFFEFLFLAYDLASKLSSYFDTLRASWLRSLF